MGRVLTILEVSQKQSYIFSSKKLQENADRSQDIAGITGSAFFAEAAGALYREADHLVNTGGGHAVLQFESREEAAAFNRKVTEAALRRYPRLELFARIMDYDPSADPGENMKRLTGALEEKKSRRVSSLRQLDLGTEALAADPDDPPSSKGPGKGPRHGSIVEPPAGYRYPAQFSELAGADNFIAVVHIDGNNMGARVGGIYKQYEGKTDPDSWERCRASLQAFSAGIQADFERAFREMTEELICQLEPGEILPLRPIILAGDDVCFVTAGSLGLECARVFIEKLTAMTNRQDGKPYAACAGVALVHQKYPFHRAYQLAEELCSNAKKFCAELDKERRVSAMDWHIEFGQLKDSLTALREDYWTEDGCRLELRPVSLVIPAAEDSPIPGIPQRSYRFFKDMCAKMKEKSGIVARSKLKELRTAMKQGQTETRFFLQEKQIRDLLYDPLEAVYTLREWPEQLKKKDAFLRLGEGPARCLFFDSIEMIDHFTALKEGES